MAKRRRRQSTIPAIEPPAPKQENKTPPDGQHEIVIAANLETRRYQILTIRLTDGRLIEATVPAFIAEGDDVAVESITVSEPMSLPDDMHFTRMGAPQTAGDGNA